MKKTLYLKFLLAYVIFGIFGFIIISVFVPNLTSEQLTREKANTLYSEATLIADRYGSGLYTSDTSLESVKNQLDILSVYLDADIRIINPSGRMVVTTEHPLNVDEVEIIENFDPTITANSHYNVSTFFDSYEEPMLNVIAPITNDYKVNGYVVIHASMTSINESCDSLLTISYITMCILFLLSIIILIFFTEIVY